MALVGHTDGELYFSPSIFYNKLIQNILVSIELIEKQNVLNHFPDLINAWCEVKVKELKLKPEQISTLAVKTFSDTFSPDYIRKNIDDKYKVSYRQQNAKLGFLKKLGKLESSIKENLYQSSVYERK